MFHNPLPIHPSHPFSHSFLSSCHPHLRLINYFQETQQLRRTYKPRFEFTFNKLYVWNLVEYERVMYLDADNVIVNNIDELFYCGHFCVAFFNPAFFHTGMMIVKPDRAEFTRLLKNLLTFSTFSYDGADQGFLTAEYPELEGAPMFDPAEVLADPAHPKMYEHKGMRFPIEYNFNSVYWYPYFSFDYYRRARLPFSTKTLPVGSISYCIGPEFKPWNWFPYIYFHTIRYWNNVRMDLDDSFKTFNSLALALLTLTLIIPQQLLKIVRKTQPFQSLRNKTRILASYFPIALPLLVFGVTFAAVIIVVGDLVPQTIPPLYAWPIALATMFIFQYNSLTTYAMLVSPNPPPSLTSHDSLASDSSSSSPTSPSPFPLPSASPTPSSTPSINDPSALSSPSSSSSVDPSSAPSSSSSSSSTPSSSQLLRISESPFGSDWSSAFLLGFHLDWFRVVLAPPTSSLPSSSSSFSSLASIPSSANLLAFNPGKTIPPSSPSHKTTSQNNDDNNDDAVTSYLSRPSGAAAISLPSLPPVSTSNGTGVQHDDHYFEDTEWSEQSSTEDKPIVDPSVSPSLPLRRPILATTPSGDGTSAAAEGLRTAALASSLRHGVSLHILVLPLFALLVAFYLCVLATWHTHFVYKTIFFVFSVLLFCGSFAYLFLRITSIATGHPGALQSHVLVIIPSLTNLPSPQPTEV